MKRLVMRIYRLENVVQNYAWGSTTAISQITRRPTPSEKPQAELWMGTHPKGPSRVQIDDHTMALQELIEQQPVDILGPHTAKHYNNALPFLFKILAAARPLSIQAHPDMAQAREGYARENRTGKPVDAPDRNYRDGNHKPEIIVALTPFWGLNGFRIPETAAALLDPICPTSLKDALKALRFDGKKGLRTFFNAMMTLGDKEKTAACDEIVRKAAATGTKTPVLEWVLTLADAYPGDLGILSPALLNLVCLDPGQAMYLPAGQLHAYLDGVGIELMANSDNVLRGGLTPKHVDVSELLRIVRFQSTAVKTIGPEPARDCEAVYHSPAAEFCLSVIRTCAVTAYRAPAIRSVEILLCTEGKGRMAETGCGETLDVSSGNSFLVPAAVKGYTIRGDLTLYKASVPLGFA